MNATDCDDKKDTDLIMTMVMMMIRHNNCNTNAICTQPSTRMLVLMPAHVDSIADARCSCAPTPTRLLTSSPLPTNSNTHTHTAPPHDYLSTPSQTPLLHSPHCTRRQQLPCSQRARTSCWGSSRKRSRTPRPPPPSSSRQGSRGTPLPRSRSCTCRRRRASRPRRLPHCTLRCKRSWPSRRCLPARSSGPGSLCRRCS